MAGHRKDIAADLAPGDEPVRAEYERDFYSWLREQARHLREGRIEALDRDNLAEEIESLGREQFSVEEQRLEIADVLSDDPGLRPRIGEAIARAYRRARIEAAKETGLDQTEFAATCPYSFDDIMSRAFSR